MIKFSKLFHGSGSNIHFDILLLRLGGFTCPNAVGCCYWRTMSRWPSLWAFILHTFLDLLMQKMLIGSFDSDELDQNVCYGNCRANRAICFCKVPGGSRQSNWIAALQSGRVIGNHTLSIHECFLCWYEKFLHYILHKFSEALLPKSFPSFCGTLGWEAFQYVAEMLDFHRSLGLKRPTEPWFFVFSLWLSGRHVHWMHVFQYELVYEVFNM